LSGIALAHHTISFTLWDEGTGKKHLQTVKFDGPEKTFAAIFGGSWIDKLVPVDNERSPCQKVKKKISLRGRFL